MLAQRAKSETKYNCQSADQSKVLKLLIQLMYSPPCLTVARSLEEKSDEINIENNFAQAYIQKKLST